MKGCLFAFMLFIGASLGTCADLTSGVAAFEGKDYPTALQELEPLAEQGIAPAEHYIGLMLSNGWGVATDGPRAAKLIRQSAHKGFVKAQVVMGFAHITGAWLVGVEESDAESFRWFFAAAQQGNAGAQHQVGMRYESGWGVSQDYAEALKWYKLGAENGYAASLGKVGAMHLRGRGVPRDAAKGIALMKAAVKKGDTSIALMLAEVYTTGEGTPQDLEQAYAWAQIATKALWPDGARFAAQMRDEIGKALTPSERRKAEQLAVSWFPPPGR